MVYIVSMSYIKISTATLCTLIDTNLLSLMIAKQGRNMLLM